MDSYAFANDSKFPVNAESALCPLDDMRALNDGELQIQPREQEYPVDLADVQHSGLQPCSGTDKVGICELSLTLAAVLSKFSTSLPETFP